MALTVVAARSGPMRGVGARLRELAAARGLSDAKVAEQASIQQRRYSHYVNDTREPDFATLKRICQVLGTTPDHVLGVSAKATNAGLAEERSEYLPLFPGTLAPGIVEIGKTEFASIGRYDARLSAGPGSIIDPHAEPLGYQLVEMSWLQTLTNAKPERLALLRVDGDSMLPTLEDGDWVLIDRTQRRFTRQGIYALAVGDDAWIKRMMMDLAEKKVRVISDNPKYPPQLLPEEDLRLIGRYVALVWRRSSA